MVTLPKHALCRGLEFQAWANLTAAIALLNGGNLLLDHAAKTSGITSKMFLSPDFVAAIVCLAPAFLFYVRALARLPLSVAYPVMAGVSMTVVSTSNHYWHSPLSPVQLLGGVILFAGVALISMSSQSS